MRKLILKITNFILIALITLTLPINITKAEERSIIGSDDRLIVENADPRIAYVVTIWPDGSQTVGTGFFVSKSHVVTAGHVMYDRSKGGRYVSVTVIPGRNDTSGPFWAYVGTNKSVYHREWAENQNDEKDYGVIFLDTEVPYDIGTFKFQVRSDFTLIDTDPFDNWKTPQFKIQGYAASNTLRQWLSKGRLENVTDKKLFYNMDTEGGTSGSPIISSSGDVVGIHTNGVGGNYRHNSGVRITDEVLNQLSSWGVPFEVNNG